MARDGMTGMAAITFPTELGSLTVQDLDALRRPAFVIADTGRESDRLILQKYHSEWWNLDSGVDDSWSAEQLVRGWKHVTLLWEFPADDFDV